MQQQEPFPKAQALKLGYRQFLSIGLPLVNGHRFDEDLRSLLDSGLSTYDIAAVAGVHETTIVYWKAGHLPKDQLCQLGIHLWAQALREATGQQLQPSLPSPSA